MAKKKPTKEVATREKALPPALMSDLEECSGDGFENADKDSFAIPFLRILQKTSPQVDEDEESYIDGAKPGLFFNSVTTQLYGPEIKVIPLAYFRQFIEWGPDRGGFQCAHSDVAILDKTTRVEDEKGNKQDVLENGNIIVDTRMHYVLLADYLDAGPIILSLTSTGVKHSKKWMTNMKMLRLPDSDKAAPMFSSIYLLRSVKNKKDTKMWYQVGDKSATAIENITWINEEQLGFAIAARDLITSGDAEVDYNSTVDAKPDEEEAF